MFSIKDEELQDINKNTVIMSGEVSNSIWRPPNQKHLIRQLVEWIESKF